MTLVPRKEPVPSLLGLRGEMDRLFDRFLEGFGPLGLDGSFVPSLDVVESDEEIVVRADLPGVDPKKVDISIRGNMLCLRGERQEEREEKGKSFYRVERMQGSFVRTVDLPVDVDSARVKAEYANGVLTITLPKKEGVRPRSIPIQVS